jgi:hemoglobin
MGWLRRRARLPQGCFMPLSLGMDTPVLYPTESQIEDLVATFYARIRTHPSLGPIFERVIGDDWTPHLKVMCNFWSSVMLTTGRYKGRPIPAHVRINRQPEGSIEPPLIQPKHFAEWLTLFEATAKDLFAPDLAASFIEKANRIAESLKLGFAFHSPTPEIWADLPSRAIPQTVVRPTVVKTSAS